MEEGAFERALEKFANEVIKLLRLKALAVLPVSTSIITDAWSIVLRDHVYEADAIQISTCAYGRSDAFLSADRGLIGVAKRIGVNAFDVVRDGKRIRELVKG